LKIRLEEFRPTIYIDEVHKRNYRKEAEKRDTFALNFIVYLERVDKPEGQ
jgi:hypothetical protein